MSRTLVLMILFNVVLGVLFVFSNYSIWTAVNQLPYTSPSWGPMSVHFVPRDFVNGGFIYAQLVVNLFNYPFWLFWVAIVGNILFAILIQRSKDTS